MKSVNSHRRNRGLKPGQKVLIRFNPHHSDGKDMPGTIVANQPGAGFGGCDLARVLYRNPTTGRPLVRPIFVDFLTPLATS